MYSKFSGNKFSRYLVELASEGTGASQDDTVSTLYLQAERYESKPRRRI